MIKIILFLLGASLPCSVFADNYSVTPEYLQTSDNFFFSQLNVDYTGFRSDTWWPYVNEPENGAGWTAHVGIINADTPLENLGVYRLQFGIHNKRSKRNSWTLRAGVIHVDETTREAYVDAIGTISSKGSWTNNSWYSIELSKDYLFMQRLILSGPQEQLRSYNVIPSVLYNGWKNQRLFYRGHYSQMDHDNIRAETDIQWMFGISQYQPWFWLGLGANHLTYKDSSNGYWSPEEFLTYGARSEFSYGWGDFQVSAGLNYNLFKEKSFEQGEGYYSSLALQYGRREANHIRLTGTAMESAQGTSDWRSSSIMLHSFIQF